MRRVLVAALPLLSLAFAWAGGDTMYEPVFREGKPTDVLVRGEPALLRGDLDAFVDLTQAAFALSIPAEKEQALRDTLEVGFESAGPDKRQAFLDSVRPATNLREKARQGDKDAVRTGLESFRRAIDQRLQALPRARASLMLGEMLVRRDQIVWAGDPPVRGGAADAWIEMGSFVASLGVNQSVQPTAGQADALRRDLDAALRGQDAAVRRRVDSAHRVWLLVKGLWRTGDEAKRFPMRWEAVRLAARALPPGKPYEVQAGSTLTDYAREAGNVGTRTSGYDVLSNLARNPGALLEALEKGLGVPKEVPEEILLYP